MKLPSISTLRTIAIASLALTFADQAFAAIIVSDNFNTLDNPDTGIRNASGKYSAGANASVWWYESTNGLSTAGVSTPSASGKFFRQLDSGQLRQRRRSEQYGCLAIRRRVAPECRRIDLGAV